MQDQNQNRKEELAERFAAYHDVPGLVLIANSTGEIVFANNSVKEILGYDPHMLLGDQYYTRTHVDFDKLEIRRNVVAQMAAGTYDITHRHLYETPLKTADDNIRWIQWSNKRIDGNLILGLGQDVTGKIELKESLLQKSKENELLLQEIHHRVKNNLQIISSLLNLQFKDFKVDIVQRAIDKSKARINAMALVHNMLYRSDDLSSVHFGPYLADLTESICKSYGCPKDFQKNIQTCEATFDIDLTINLGMIITELVSNIFEHAYPEAIDQSLDIELNKISDNEYQLIVKDDGVGISNSKHNPSECFGLELVTTLCSQINGEMKMLNGQGTTIDIRF